MMKLLMNILIVVIIGCADQNQQNSDYSKFDSSSSNVEQDSLVGIEQKDTSSVELFPDTVLNWHKQPPNLTDTVNFNIVKEYIKSLGNVSRVNVSGMTADTSMVVTYHTVYLEGMEISVDHTDRIYMNFNNRHYGNILKENDSVSPEINYGMPDKNPELTKKKEIRVLKIYSKLIVLALR